MSHASDDEKFAPYGVGTIFLRRAKILPKRMVFRFGNYQSGMYSVLVIVSSGAICYNTRHEEAYL